MTVSCRDCARYRQAGERFCGHCGARLDHVPRASFAAATIESDLDHLLRRGYGALKLHRGAGDTTRLYAVRPPHLACPAPGWVWLDVYRSPRDGELAHLRAVEYRLADLKDWLGPAGWLPFEPAGATVPQPIALPHPHAAPAAPPVPAATPGARTITLSPYLVWLCCLLPGLLLGPQAPLPAIACLAAGAGLAWLYSAAQGRPANVRDDPAAPVVQPRRWQPAEPPRRLPGPSTALVRRAG